jgi:hypothetical protein
MPAGFCGTRLSSPFYYGVSSTQREEDMLSSAPDEPREAFLLLIGEAPDNHIEIIRCNAYAQFQTPTPPVSSTLDAIGAYLPQTAVHEDSVFTEPHLTANPGMAPFLWILLAGRYDVQERGALGTTARNWPTDNNAPYVGRSSPRPIRIFDITIPVALAQARLRRFGMGCPIAKIRTSMEHYDLQLGEFITLNSDVYLNFRANGAGTETVWEIISKEVKVLDDSTCIEWTIAWVRDSLAFITPLETEIFVPVIPPILTLDDPITDNNDVWVTAESGELVYRG